jgi:Transmembrane amino acid transporter protein
MHILLCPSFSIVLTIYPNIISINSHTSLKQLVFSAIFPLGLFLLFFSFFCLPPILFLTKAFNYRAIQKSDCYHKEGHQAPCSYGDSFFMILFGAVQILLCLIPDFHEMAWLSILAAIMSFAYSSIGFGLGLAKVIGTPIVNFYAY